MARENNNDLMQDWFTDSYEMFEQTYEKERI